MIKKQDIVFAIVNSLTTLILFCISQSFYLNGLEDYNIFYLGPWLKALNDKQEHENSDRFLFVDTNFDNSIIENNSNGFVNGNIVITDRAKLKQFFSKLQIVNNHKYVVCDIFFDRETKNDKQLKEVMSTTNRLIIPRKDSLEFTDSKFRGLNSGLVDLYLPNNSFYKFKLFENNVKSLPLKMFEDINSIEMHFDFNFPFYFSSKGLVFNDFVPLLEIKNKNIKKRGGHYLIIPPKLGQ